MRKLKANDILRISETLRDDGFPSLSSDIEALFSSEVKSRKLEKLAVSSSLPPKFKNLPRDRQQVLLRQIDELLLWSFRRFKMIGDREVKPSDKDWLKIYFKADVAKLLTTLVDLAMLRHQGKG